VVGSGMQDLVHATTVDIDDDPEAKTHYAIQALPTLVINDEIVLEGGMDDDSVRDLLWSTLMNQAISSEKAADLTKKSLLALTMNAMNSLDGSRILRPSVGDYTHIGVYQQYLLSLYSLDPLIPHLLYKAGYQLGMYGMMHHVLTLLNPKLGRTPKRKLRFKQLAKALELYFSDREILPTLLAESASVVTLTETYIDLKVQDLASASIRIDVGEPMCGFIAGQLAGVTSAVMGFSGLDADCQELICLANGGEACIFRISIGPTTVTDLPPVESKIERVERRQNFYEVIHEMTRNIQDSKLMRKIQRISVRDFVHISALQPIIVSLKFLDRFSGTILYNGGKELGVFGPGKDLLYSLVNELGIHPPVPIDKGVKLILKYLTHPTNLLAREHGSVVLHSREDSVYHLEIIDNVSIAGMQDAGLDQKFCDFQAGFIAGRLYILIGVDPTVREIECQGTGAQSCTFEITVQLNKS
ncbi:MAG: V4R domain-containing protein, partial [Candidatus Kariarchaeaceae archaeon]